MNLLRTTFCILTICLFAVTISAQSTNSHMAYAHNDILTPKSPTPASNFESAKQNAKIASLISQSYLDPSSGFIGLVFSNNIKEPSIYYKIVDSAGREVYNGSAHAAPGSTPTLYYNTENLPGGTYRVFIENADFFLSTSFIK